MYVAPSEKTILRLLAEATDAAEAILQDALAGTPLQSVTRAQVTVFRVLHLRGPANVGDLARAVGITAQAMGESVRRLERDGFVEVAPDPKDSRVRVVMLSPLGSDLLRAMWKELSRLEAQIAALVGAQRLAELRADLVLIAGLRPGAPAVESADVSNNPAR